MKAPTNLDEYDAIAKTVPHYTDGARSGRGADMQPAFHQDATIFGYADGEIFAGPIQKLFESVDQDTPATGLQAPDGQYRHHRHDCRGAAGTRRLERPPLHRSVHQSQRGVEDHEQGFPSAP